MQIAAKIEEIISELSIEEKVAMCHANSKFTSSGVERLGIDELVMSDGPHGVRAEVARDSWDCLNRPEDKCTYLPTETALAATFNTDLALRFGETLGSEARARGKDIILGPGVNIIRTPLCGRNFEYLSEDPYLTAKMAVPIIKGIQSQDVAACVKHYALNNQELDRSGVNVEVSDRALHEIYLRGFHDAIVEGGALSVMGAYNLYKNQHCCHNEYLVNDVLKGEWGFKGVYLTDWAGAHDTDECIHNGLDLEMGTNKPYNEYYLADEFLKKAEESQEVRDLLDDKVRRILYLMLSINKTSPDRNKGEFNTKKHQKTAYDIAAESMVLLKNNNNFLPLDTNKCKKVLVVGPNAKTVHHAGGNSSAVHALYEISAYDGIVNRFNGCEIEYERGIADIKYHPIATEQLNIIDMKAGCRACKIESVSDDGKQNTEFCETFNLSEGTGNSYDMSLSCQVPESGKFSFKFTSNTTFTAYINDENVADKKYSIWHKYQSSACCLDFEKGETVEIKVHIEKKTDTVYFDFGWLTPSDHLNSSDEQNLLKKAAEADTVIYCGGLNHSYDTESFDKKDMKLPAEQQTMIPKFLAANQNTVLVMTAGSPFEMPWIDDASAVVWTWYSGMEWGNALADILKGTICPSGKMPFTLPKHYEDTPVYRYGEYKAKNCKYNEDIFVGYRGFDKDNIEPLFPFGYGLSYSKFEYSDLSIAQSGNEYINVTFSITNIGNVSAKETAQIYVGYPESSVVRPVRELKGFKKIELAPQETKTISIDIALHEFAPYYTQNKSLKNEKKTVEIMVGSCSRDIRIIAQQPLEALN